MEILSPGEKIRRLRKDLGLNQGDLANDLLTRSLISMIENGKRKLTLDSAKIISTRLNHYYRPLGKAITPEYLMESEGQQVARYISRELEGLRHLKETKGVEEQDFESIFQYIGQLAKNYGLDSVYHEVLYRQGQYHYKKYQYKKALACFNQVLEYNLINRNYHETAKLYNEIGKCNYMLLYLETAIVYYSRAYETAVQQNISNHIKLDAIHNLILTYYKHGKYQQALQMLRKFRGMDTGKTKPRLMNNLLLIESTIYRNIGNLDKAEKILNLLVFRKDQLHNDTQALLYANLSILYRIRGDFHKAYQYIQLAITLKKQIAKAYLPNILLQLAEYYRAVEAYPEAIETLKEIHSISKEMDLNEGLIDTCFLFTEVYLELKDYQQAEAYIRQAEEVILSEESEIAGKKQVLYTYYVDLYNDMDNKEKCKEYTKKLREQFAIFN